MSEAVILCGGLSKRLRPLTKDIPKALVKIKGKTLLERQIKQLKNYGINRIVLATGYLDKEIQDYILKLKHLNDIEIILSREKEPLGTAGALKLALKHIKSHDFFVTNVDDIYDVDFNELSKNKIPTIALGQYKCRFGVVGTSGNDVVYFQEKPTIPDVWVNIGAYYLNKDILLPDIGSLERDVFPNIHLKAYKHTGHWQTVNTVKDLEEVEVAKWIK